jgi:hypothetical protein
MGTFLPFGFELRANRDAALRADPVIIDECDPKRFVTEIARVLFGAGRASRRDGTRHGN